MTTALAEEFEAHRPRMFGLAYRMLGSAEEAEDAVQDAYLRLGGADRSAIEHLGAWLAKTVTNLCLNRLTSARARRERYVGSWLPEPVVTSGGTLGPLESAEQRDAVSTAMLVLLERLTPTERAVYVLREAFAYGHREIAEVLGVTEASCRQLYRRAVGRVAQEDGRFEPSPERQAELVASFLAAAQHGDLPRLEKLLVADVTWWADGGGKVTAALRPVEGFAKVTRFLGGIRERFLLAATFEQAELNGAPALLAWDGGKLAGTVGFAYRDGRIADMWAVVNPDKLRYLEGQLGRG